MNEGAMKHNETEALFVEDRAEHVPESAAHPPPVTVVDRAADETAADSRRRAPTMAILQSLEHIDRRLDDIRRTLDALAREKRHREFSPARLLGSILQALVAGLVLWAVSDWAFAADRGVMLVKLAFAAVLQLSAHTAFVLGREVD